MNYGILFNLTCLCFPRSWTLVIIHCNHHTPHTTSGEVGFKAATTPLCSCAVMNGKVLSVVAFLTPSLSLDVFQHVMISCKWPKLKNCTIFQVDYNFITAKTDLKIKTKKNWSSFNFTSFKVLLLLWKEQVLAQKQFFYPANCNTISVQDCHLVGTSGGLSSKSKFGLVLMSQASLFHKLFIEHLLQ